MSNDKLEIKEVPPSQIPNAGINPTKLNYDLIVKEQIKYWSNVDTTYRQQYAKGSYMGSNTSAAEYEQVIGLLISCIFQSLRDHINQEYDESQVEERQNELIKVSAIEDVFVSGLSCLKSLNKKLDINSVLTILLGSLNETTKKSVKGYEDRYSAKH